MKDDFPSLLARYAPILGLVPGGILAGYLIGYGLDAAFGTTVLRYVFAGLGIVSALVQTFRILSRDTQ